MIKSYRHSFVRFQTLFMMIRLMSRCWMSKYFLIMFNKNGLGSIIKRMSQFFVMFASFSENWQIFWKHLNEFAVWIRMTISSCIQLNVYNLFHCKFQIKVKCLLLLIAAHDVNINQQLLCDPVMSSKFMLQKFYVKMHRVHNTLVACMLHAILYVCM